MSARKRFVSSNSLGRMETSNINLEQRPAVRSPHSLQFLLDIFEDFVKIIYLVMYGVYTFLIYVPLSWIIQPKRKSLKEEVILVVGANSSGAAKSVCKRLAKENAEVIILIDTSGQDDELLELLTKCGSRAKHFQVESYARDSLDSCIEKIKAEFLNEPITSVFLLTEMISVGPLLSTSPTETLKIFETNLLSGFHVVQRLFPDFLENNRGHVVTLAYPAFTSWGKKTLVPYISSKCGIEGFVESLDDEVRHHLNNANIKFTEVFTNLHLTQNSLDAGSSIRHPTLFPVLSDEAIAESVVDGYQRNKRYVYVPGRLGLCLWLESFVPAHFIKKAQSLMYPSGCP